MKTNNLGLITLRVLLNTIWLALVLLIPVDTFPEIEKIGPYSLKEMTLMACFGAMVFLTELVVDSIKNVCWKVYLAIIVLFISISLVAANYTDNLKNKQILKSQEMKWNSHH